MFKIPSFRISPGILFLEVLIVTLSSCIKEEFNVDVLNPSVRISPGVAAPIGFVHYRIEELFTDSIIPEEFTVDEDGFITMKYKEEIASASAVDIFIFDDISFIGNIPNNTGAPIILDNIPPGSSLTLEDTIRIPFNIPSAPGAEVDSIIVDSMEFRYSATSNLDGLVTLTSSIT